MSPIRIELPTMFGMKTVNCYLFIKPEPILIDCGEKSDASWEALQKGLANHDLTIQDIKKVIITHAHVDHIGMAGKIVANSDAIVLVSDYVYNWAIDNEKMWDFRVNVMSKTIGKVLRSMENSEDILKNTIGMISELAKKAWDNVPAERVQTFRPDAVLEFGGSKWQSIYLPGHCINQTCFYQAESKQFLAADMLLQITPTPVLDTTLEPPYERSKSIHQLLASFEQVKALDIEQVYPGHYKPFTNHQAVIDYQVNRIHQRKEECFALIKAGTNDFSTLLNALYKNRLSLPAIAMLVGYLDLLMDEGRVLIEEKEKGSFYKVA
ncbi:MAG: MBL fold metallo-hydrolase [Chitinophagales bacterium]